MEDLKSKRIMVIAAHPDDEILGCGGTIARLADDGYEVYTLILGEGITSRGNIRIRKKRENEIDELKEQTERANAVLGVKKVFLLGFSDNRFDSIPLLDIIKKVEKIKNKVKPEIVFTHYKNDLNVDHRKTYEATITATRPMEDETVRTIYSFEVLSSTEWNYPTMFSPNVFFDVSKTIDKKIESMKCYKDELKDEDHPRSINAIEINSRLWGIKSGMKYSEAFVLVRSNI